jgi:hypothetical protein
MRFRGATLPAAVALVAFPAGGTALLPVDDAQRAAASTARVPEPGPRAAATSRSLRAAHAISRRAARQAILRRDGHGFAAARVTAPLTLRTAPGGRAVGRLGPTTEFGSPQVAGVAAVRGRWIGLVTPALPNGRLGWVARGHGLRLQGVAHSLHADLSKRILELRRGRRVLRRVRVAVGRPGSPTPIGRFAVTDKLAGAAYSPYYGCCILALSGRQPNPPPGWSASTRIAIHGTNAPGTIGQAASAGCLRAGEADLRALMRSVPLGTPVFIRR